MYLLGFQNGGDCYMANWCDHKLETHHQNDNKSIHAVFMNKPGDYYFMRGKWRRDLHHWTTKSVGFRKVLRLGWSKPYEETVDHVKAQTVGPQTALLELAKTAQYYAPFETNHTNKKERQKEWRAIEAITPIPMKWQTHQGNEVLITLIIIIFVFIICYCLCNVGGKLLGRYRRHTCRRILL